MNAAALRHASPLARRSFIERCAQVCFGLSIFPWARPAGAATPDAPAAGLPGGAGWGSAKAVIFLQMQGGMSHIDTFDPKTGASKGPQGPIQTKASFQVSGYLPKTAAIADKVTLIRSLTAKVGVHEAAQYLLRTGYEQRGTVVHPMLGAWAQHFLGASHKSLPSSVSVNRTAASGNGFFSAALSPLPVLDPDDGLQFAQSPHGADVAQKRLGLLNTLDSSFRQKFPDANVKAYNDFYEHTLKLMKSAELSAFDLEQEPDKVRDRYGRHKFGQGCLLARRLVQAGVRFVEVASGGWDMHNNLADEMEEKGGELDEGFAALVSDLAAEGLLDRTLVVIASEFGRKPEFDGTGRGHHPSAFGAVLAGAGVKRGHVHGATDPLGKAPVDKPMSVADLHATIAHAAGLPLDKEVKSSAGRPFTVGNKGKAALEIFA